MQLKWLKKLLAVNSFMRKTHQHSVIRLENWMTRFKLDIEAKGLDNTKDDIKIRASILLLMGHEELDTYKAKSR